jgi:hypothetical protein
LDREAIARVLAGFPGIKIEERDGYVVAPWHGREDGERGEAFAARSRPRPAAWWPTGGTGRSSSLGS